MTHQCPSPSMPRQSRLRRLPVLRHYGRKLGTTATAVAPGRNGMTLADRLAVTAGPTTTGPTTTGRRTSMTEEELAQIVESKLAAQLEARLQADRARVRMEVISEIRREAERKHYDRINARHPIEDKYGGL